MKRSPYELAPLSEVLSFANGKSIKPGGQGEYPVYGSNGLIGGSNEHKHDDGIIIGRVGAYCGSVARCRGKFWASDNTIVAQTVESEASTDFFYYLLKIAGLNRYAGGSAQPLLTQTVLRQVELPIPRPSAQRKIAAILSAYDDLIGNNARRIEVLEEMAQALYREWFVRFRFPGHEKARMLDSPLGEIPGRWSVVKLSDYIELAYGKALTQPDRRGGPFPVYGSSGVVGYHDEALVDGPGIIVGRKGNVGSVHWSETSFYPIDTVYYVVTELPLHYVFYNLQYQNFINSDAAVPGLSRKQAYSLPLVVPSKPVMDAFSSQMGPLFSLTRTLRRQSDNLETTRDLLLSRLISGQIDVSNLAINIGKEAA